MKLIVIIAAVMVSTIPAWAQEPTWRTVGRWKGAENKITEPFEITSQEWRIVWERTAVGYIFGIYACRFGPSSVTGQWSDKDEIVARAGSRPFWHTEHEATTIVKGAGRFYLFISAGFAPYVWTVTVQERVSP